MSFLLEYRTNPEEKMKAGPLMTVRIIASIIAAVFFAVSVALSIKDPISSSNWPAFFVALALIIDYVAWKMGKSSKKDA